MSFTFNVTQLLEKQISSKVINGLWKVEDIETDCDDGKTNFENLFTDPNHKHTKKTEENAFCTSALKTDIEPHARKTLTKLKVTKRCKGVNETSLKKENHDDNTNIHSSVREKNEDEIDFFDSDDEYLETHGLRFDEYFVLDEFMETTNSCGGRYSEGIDRFKNLPVYRRSIQEFANANDFEIYDLIPDGNCMFRALSDQFMINGRLGYTAERLRNASIEYLRSHHHKDHGHHIQSFLCKETWEDYLERMSRTKEWGDHIILQALVDAFNLHVTIFNVFEDDVRHTILQPEAYTKRKRMHVFLGHVGEFHYLSLRPSSWTELWPYKSLMYRTTVCSRQNTSSARLAKIRKAFTELKINGLLSEDEFTDMIDIDNDIKSANSTNPVTDSHVTVKHQQQFFETYALHEKELQEADEKPEHSVVDPMHIDVVTGIPLLHLSYVFKQLLPGNMILPYTSGGPFVLIYSDIVAYLVGSRPVGMDVYLKDISKGQRKRDFYNKCSKTNFKAAILSPNIIVRHIKTNEDFHSASTFYVDSSKTHAGYCHVRVCLNEADTNNHNVVQRVNEKYLTGIENFPRNFLPTNIVMTYEGLKCDTFPPEAQEWIDRKRKFSFPSQWLFQTILRQKCTLIKKAHQYSSDPDIEWKYDFTLADQTIFTTGLSNEQLEGFSIVKVLIDNVSLHLQKKLKHLKAVFFKALEEIPNEMWSTNFGGCILFVISSMVDCLRSRYLPHYFMPSVNLIACFSAQEIHALCVNIECIRMFPLFVIQITAESHGYTYAQKLIKMVLKDCRSFRHNKDLMTLFTDSFMPATLGVLRVFTKIGFYEIAFQQLINLHEDMRLVKMSADSNDIPHFEEVFEIALGKFRQKSTRVILAMLFEKYFKTAVLCKVINQRSIFARDILPWKTHFEIEWMEIPSEKVSDDLSTLAEYFFSCSLKEFEKRNSTLATANLETAITCLQRCIKMNTDFMDNVDDEQLKKEIVTQKETILLNLKHRLKMHYIWIWNVTKLYLMLEPLIDHMNDIEKLCLELPEMAGIVGDMFRYLKRKDKAVKYWEKAGLRKTRRAL